MHAMDIFQVDNKYLIGDIIFYKMIELSLKVLRQRGLLSYVVRSFNRDIVERDGA